MEALAPYWQQVTLTSAGKVKRLAQPEAQDFLSRLEAVSTSAETAGRTLQRYLMTVYHGTASDQFLAEACLRNFITYSLYQRCVTLAQRFGQGQSNPEALVTQIPFTAIELFCCIFESPLTSTLPDEVTDLELYDPLTTKILTTFDPEKGSLSSWCTICFQGSRAIKRFLREHGIILETDWQLLCRTREGKLQRILTAANCTAAEITTYGQLLHAFHVIYRTQLDDQRRTHPSRRPYPAPTEPQLVEISHYLSSPTSADVPTLRGQLKQLAQYVRQDRCRGPSPPTSAAPTTSSDHAIEQLLESYCQPCLSKAVEQTVDQRLVQLRQKRNGDNKANQFLQALTLFYCDSQPMKEIAAAVGLRDQPSVSRLLKRDNLQADIRRQILACLLQRVRALAAARQSPEQLQSLDEHITAFIAPYVDRVVAADQREGYTSKHRQMTSAYATHLCHCATARRYPS